MTARDKGPRTMPILANVHRTQEQPRCAKQGNNVLVAAIGRCRVGTQRWYHEVVPRGGTMRWYPEVVPGGGTQRWYP